MHQNSRDPPPPAPEVDPAIHVAVVRQEVNALCAAVVRGSTVSQIVTDADGVIQVYNDGAERLLGYSSSDVVHTLTPVVFHDPAEVKARAEALSLEFGVPVRADVEGLLFKAARGLEDTYEVTQVRTDGTRFTAAVSVTALRDPQDAIIGYLFTGRDTATERRAEVDRAMRHEEQERDSDLLRASNATLRESEERLSVTLNSIGDGVIATDALGRVTRLNPVAVALTGWSQAEARDVPVDQVFHIIGKTSRAVATVPVAETLARGTTQGLTNHTILVARDGTERDIADSCAPIRDADHNVVGAVLIFRDVTPEFAAQQAVRDSASLVQAILNTVSDGIVTFHTITGVVETINPAAERIFGYSAAELVGRDFRMLIPELGRYDDALELLRPSAAQSALGLGREVVGRGKDGVALPMEVSASAMQLGGRRYLTVLLRDIRARKEAEEAQRKAGALQNAIFNSANFSSIATDARGVIQIFNVGAERMLGYLAADVMNKITPADISDPEEVVARARALSLELGTPITPGFEALVFKASRGIEDIYELTYIRKDGSRFPAVVSVTALRDAQDGIIGYLLIGTDNTARKQVEEERKRFEVSLQETNAALEVAKIVAEKANRAKSDFLSSMSHELRSPLNAILGFAQLMDSDTPPASPAQKASIEQILRAGWYLLELINEILDLAVVESGRLSMSVEPVLLADVLHDCQTMMEPQGTRRGLTLIFPGTAAPQFVLADRVRLKQVLINLVSNAIKYNRSSGMVVVDYVHLGPERIRVRVRDTGSGLSRDKLSELFQPFNRLGQESGVEEGTGIGLVMSKLLVELMGGVIGVESVEGVGSVFWFDLSVASQPELLTGDLDGVDSIEVQPADGATRRTILYVEDNVANLQLVRQLLARRPHLRLLTAVTGDIGVELARLHRPDLVLMDINLPILSGFEVLKLLRGDARTAHIPVLAVSANAMEGDIRKGLAAGFYGYVTKPIHVTRFMEALDAGLELSRVASNPPDADKTGA